MRTLLSLIFLLVLTVPVAAAELQALQNENLLLKAELQLARTGKLYLLVDLRNQAILIKGGGATIWRLPVSRSRIYGSAPAPKMRRLVAKKSLFAPSRPVVPIAGGEEGKGQAAEIGDTVLELEDMPDNYRLLLDDGTMLVVEPERADWRGRIGLLWSGTWGGLRRVFHRLRPWGPVAGSEVLLSLAGTDARRLYWSFDLETPCLLKQPAEQP
jgi:hypothetical protein